MVNPPPTSSDTKNETDFEEYPNDDEETQVIADIEDYVDKNGRFIYQKPEYEKMLNTRVAPQLHKKLLQVI